MEEILMDKIEFEILKMISIYGEPNPAEDYHKSISDVYDIEEYAPEDIAIAYKKMEDKGWIKCFTEDEGDYPIVSNLTILKPGTDAYRTYKEQLEKEEYATGTDIPPKTPKYKYASFLYSNKEHFMDAIKEFTQKCIDHNLIPKNIDYKTMEKLFAGEPTNVVIPWIGQTSILAHLIKELTQKDNPIIDVYPMQAPKWEIVSCRFCDKGGKPLKDLHNTRYPKRYGDIIVELADVFKEW